MINFSFFKHSWTRVASFFTLIHCSHLLKVSYIVGSYASFFSAGSIVAPLSGAFLGSSGAVWMFGLSIVLRILLVGFNPFLLLVHHLPGLCAAWYWSTRHWTFSIVLPIVCIVLFVMHPVGGHAWLYSLYWFIPIVLFKFKQKSIYLDALSSTFIAHAVGSVLWLYGKPMTAAMWIGLIPVVCVERLVFATSMTVVYYLIKPVVHYAQEKSCYA